MKPNPTTLLLSQPSYQWPLSPDQWRHLQYLENRQLLVEEISGLVYAFASREEITRKTQATGITEHISTTSKHGPTMEDIHDHLMHHLQSRIQKPSPSMPTATPSGRPVQEKQKFS